MPRYYFDIDDGAHFTRDEEGVVLADPEAARAAAIDVLPNIARDVPPPLSATSDGHDDGCRLVVKVRDESGLYVLQASLSIAAEWLGTTGST